MGVSFGAKLVLTFHGHLDLQQRGALAIERLTDVDTRIIATQTTDIETRSVGDQTLPAQTIAANGQAVLGPGIGNYHWVSAGQQLHMERRSLNAHEGGALWRLELGGI